MTKVFQRTPELQICDHIHHGSMMVSHTMLPRGSKAPHIQHIWSSVLRFTLLFLSFMDIEKTMYDDLSTCAAAFIGFGFLS